MTSLCADVCLCRCGTQRKGQRTTRGALIDATLCFCDATSPERDARLATTKGFGRTKKKELSRNLLAVRSRISIYYTPTLYGKPFPVLRQLVSPLSSKKKRKKRERNITAAVAHYTYPASSSSSASSLSGDRWLHSVLHGSLVTFQYGISQGGRRRVGGATVFHSLAFFFFCCRNNIKRGEEVKVATEAHLLPFFCEYNVKCFQLCIFICL